MNPMSALAQALRDPEAAEWAQTVAVVLGLAIAIWVPWIQRRNELNDRKIKEKHEAVGLALLIFPDLLDYCKKIQAAIVSVEVKDRGYLISLEVELANQGTSWELFDSLQIALGLPPSILERIDLLHKLGPLASGVQDLVHLSRVVQGDFALVYANCQGANDPMDMVVAKSAVSSAKVLKACAYRVRNQFWRFLGDNVEDRFIQHVRRADRYEY
jgi:hypothetical protein